MSEAQSSSVHNFPFELYTTSYLLLLIFTKRPAGNKFILQSSVLWSFRGRILQKSWIFLKLVSKFSIKKLYFSKTENFFENLDSTFEQAKNYFQNEILFEKSHCISRKVMVHWFHRPPLSRGVKNEVFCHISATNGQNSKI